MPVSKSTDGHAQPGDLVPVVVALRRLMAEFDTSGYLLDVDFTGIGPEVEGMMLLVRPCVREAADQVFNLIGLLEKLPEFKRQKASKDRHHEPTK